MQRGGLWFFKPTLTSIKRECGLLPLLGTGPRAVCTVQVRVADSVLTPGEADFRPAAVRSAWSRTGAHRAGGS